MKILLYDRDPDRHKINVEELKPMGLTAHTPGEELPDFKQFSAIVIHTTDEKTYRQAVASMAIKRNLQVVLYSGQYSLATDREAELRTQYPGAHLSSVLVADLSNNIRGALLNNDVAELTWNRLSDVQEILSTLWAVGVVWESYPQPGVSQSTDTVSDEWRSEVHSLLTQSESLSWRDLGNLRTPKDRVLRDLSSRIYGRSPRPDTDFKVLSVSTHEEYYDKLSLLRESLLAWAQSAP